MRKSVFAILVLLMTAGGAHAFDFEPLKPLDTAAVDPALLTDIYGAWEIRDTAGKRRCRIVLKQEAAIGGSGVEVAPGCAKAFPVLDDIAAWRLVEGWAIDLVDPLRKTRVRFYTPDARYVATGDARDIAGMDRFDKVVDRPAAKGK